MNPKYSICVTTYNCISTIKESLDSILSQIDQKYEVIVVDNRSTDGSLEVLQELARDNKVRLIVEKTSRGCGRQRAFEHSKGEFIIDHIDADDVYKPILSKLIGYYHANFEGNMMLCKGFFVAPRDLILAVGGWKDLQWGEDWELYARIAALGRLRYLSIQTRSRVKPHGMGPFFYKLRYRYQRARDTIRRGEPLSYALPANLAKKILFLPLAVLAWIEAKRKGVVAEKYRLRLEDYEVLVEQAFREALG
ncbi:MAG: glycosyltransferase [Nitrososphaerota archaeon]|nr:glycosyltransferase [Nitrososphaerota archaeon]